jgi:hypothetical protein
MSNPESHNSAAAAKGPRQFFSTQLSGETPLSFETAELLYRLSTAMHDLKPWEFIADQDLILLEDIEAGEICYCSIMGALSGALAFQVYVGAESYRFFRKIVNGVPVTPVDFFASVRGVSVEFVSAKERGLPDRELLDAFGHPKKRGTSAPVFRAQRPGYHSWYPTEGEGKLLLRCLNTTLAFCLHVLEATEQDEMDYWEEEDVFPFLTPDPDEKSVQQFTIRSVKVSEPPTAAPRAEDLDEDLIAGIVGEHLPKSGILEVDHFFAGAMIGEKDERKSYMRMAMVTDAASGFAFQPELGLPDDSTGRLLVRALLGAMRDGRCIPTEVRVNRKEIKILLGPLSARLGFEVRIAKSLPMIISFRDHFLETVGVPGEFSTLQC